MTFTASITKRDRKRQTKSGAELVQTRFVVNFRDPATGRRKQLFFKRQKDAVAMRDAMLASVVTGAYSAVPVDLTVAGAMEHWLENRRRQVKAGTWESYRQVVVTYVIGPLMAGTKWERYRYSRDGKKREGVEFVEMLGSVRVSDLTTADIRTWHTTLSVQVSSYTANVAKKFLRTALSLAAEDFQIRVPAMPSQIGRGRIKPKKTILTPDQVGHLLKAALRDGQKGLYYAFPFLTGVRPSELLALQWEDIDFTAGVIRIRRMQERDGSITDLTKTAASTREIPMSPLLRAMLANWRPLCPTDAGELRRVFPALGTGTRQKKRGAALSYANFCLTYWRPALKALGLPYVTPHSARHAFISTLQAEGIEVGLVAKLAGHANATVTLSHYTQAVRGGEAAMEALERAFGAREAHLMQVV